MIDRRLLQLVPESRKYIALSVTAQWISLIANIVMISSVCMLIASLTEGTVTDDMVIATGLTGLTALVIHAFCIFISSRMSYLAGITVKRRLRETIFSKILRLGVGYRDEATTAEIIQMSVEGVDQLEAYYGSYLPQLFYAIITPITLLVIISRYNLECAFILFVFVPIIPVVIVLVQMWAKRMFSDYWEKYADLGNTFLENLQGLTALKIYQSDGYRNEVLNAKSEEFRQSGMRSVNMQLGSVTVMDLIAYGGAAFGIALSVLQLQSGNISLEGSLVIIFLSVEFFLPMRKLGSYLHIAMKGLAASDRMFQLLDTPETEKKVKMFPINVDVSINGLDFSYGDKHALRDIDMKFGINSITAIVGESGCGKSTLASVLMGRNRGYGGKIMIGDTELSEINENSLMRNITYVDHRSYLFKGTVKDNLIMGSPDCSENTLWRTLSELKMDTFVKTMGGLEAPISEGGANLSGGQRQRIAIARALLHDSAIYIFDECTTNVDSESEQIILERIKELAKHKIVIMISHRLANVVSSDWIYVMNDGRVEESGTHDQLMSRHGTYERIWNAQRALENYGMGGERQ